MQGLHTNPATLAVKLSTVSTKKVYLRIGFENFTRKYDQIIDREKDETDEVTGTRPLKRQKVKEF